MFPLLVEGTPTLWTFFSIGACMFLYIAWQLLNVRQRIAYRHIPGPFAAPILGHLPEMRKHGPMNMFARCSKIYGPVFKVFFGTRGFIVVTDAEYARTCMNKNTNHAPFLSVMRDRFREVDDAGLVAARGTLWRLARNAWQPAFSSGSLLGYMGLMDQSAQQLVERLQGAADSGQHVDMLAELGNMTLQVVGSCAYGVDFHLMDPSTPHQAPPGHHPGQLLAAACKDWFNTVSILNGSVYNRITVLLPWLTPLTTKIAHFLPDAPMVAQLKARELIYSTSAGLMASWRAAHGRETGSPSRAKAPSGTAVAPGSFLDLMLAARDKQTGTQLSDLEILAQAQTFILAGYETTANALSYAVYCISTNPRVEARLLEEVDSLPLGAPVTPADLDKLQYTEAIISEALRLYPPAPATTRELKEATKVGPYKLPAGTPVMISIHAIHHDPRYFKDPYDFIPERFLPGNEDLQPCNMAAFMPFGAGTRLCIGYKFGLQEMKAALLRLYQRYTFPLLPGQVPLPLRSGITLTPAHGVLVRVASRPPAKAPPRPPPAESP